MGETRDGVRRARGNTALRRKKERKKEWQKEEEMKKSGTRRQEIGVLTDRSMDPLFLRKQKQKQKQKQKEKQKEKEKEKPQKKQHCMRMKQASTACDSAGET